MAPPTSQNIRGQLLVHHIGPLAPGVVPSITVVARRRYLVHSVHFDFTSSGTGSARELVFSISDGPNMVFRSKAPSTIPPGAGCSFCLADFGFESGPYGEIVPVSLPPIPLIAGFTLAVEVINLDPLDQFSNVYSLIEEWVV